MENEFQSQPKQTSPRSYFRQKLKEVLQTPLVFKYNATHCKSQKHLSIILDSKLTFEKHYEMILSKTNRTVGILRKLQNLLPMEALTSIFVRRLLNCGDVLSD